MSEETGNGAARGVSVAALCARAPEAWERFLDEFLPVIYGTVLRTLRASTADPCLDAADLAQDVLVRLCRRDFALLRRYDPGRASLATYLGLVARSVTLDALRRGRGETVTLDETDHDQGVEPGFRHRPFEVPASVLSPRQRLVMHLLYDRELDPAEIARILDVEPQTVRSTHHKAVEKLRRHFGVGGSE